MNPTKKPKIKLIDFCKECQAFFRQNIKNHIIFFVIQNGN